MTDFVLDAQHVLVVGGTGTLGGAIAGHAASAGARVTLTSRDAAEATAAAEAIVIGEARGVAFDVTDHGSVAAVVDTGPYDHVVVASADLSFASLTDISGDDLQALVDTKLLGTMWTVRHLRPHISPRGSVLLLSGMLSRTPGGAAPLSAVNGAIESLGRALAQEYAPVRVNVISPGGVGTSGAGGHAGAPGDVAALATSVLANRWVNGAVLDIHGG